LIKKELEKLRPLLATPKMMQMAAADTPRKSNDDWESEVYKQGLYLRCRVLNGILKVAFFLPEHMRAGGRNSAYELFIDRESRKFITYDCRHDTWLTAKVDMLSWPRYISGSEQKWISQAGHDVACRDVWPEFGRIEWPYDLAS
jgi:hypothetical protein